jgi:hypothetical protein
MSALQLRCSALHFSAVSCGYLRHRLRCANCRRRPQNCLEMGQIRPIKRRGRDSNPRRTLTARNGFRDRRIQPLCHPSG